MKKLTVTFDNGPDPKCTPLVLDVLKERSIKATFFVCGQGNRLHPALRAKTDESRRILARAKKEGHWIGNHSLTHSIELVQEFPSDCVPIRNGEIVGSLDGMVCGDRPAPAIKMSKLAETMVDQATASIPSE